MKPISYPSPLGRYTLLRQWKSDDWGIAFLARQEGPAGCSKLTFLKTLAKPVAKDPTFVELFLREARVAARLSHPNIVQIYELGEVDGEYFIAMEYVHGHHLGTVLETTRAKTQSFLPVLAAQLCTQVLLGLRYAHTLEDEQGRPLNLVHKNLCPSNVLLGFNGAVKICNFGIPFLEEGNTHKLYVAPEQHVGEKMDARVDVYAAGVLLAELLLGKIPRNCSDGEQLAKVVLQHPGVPFALADIVGCALSSKRDARFESAREMALALEHYIEAAGASQITVELAYFLRQLFGGDTNSLFLLHEMVFLDEPETPPAAAPSLPPPKNASPSPSPLQKIPASPASPLEEEKIPPRPPREKTLQTPPHVYFKWGAIALWGAGAGGMVWWAVWWLLHRFF